MRNVFLKSTPILVITLFFIAGCISPTYRLYSGPQLKPGEVAILEGKTTVRLIGVDGKRGPGPGVVGFASPWTGRYHIELLPGEHKVHGFYLRYESHRRRSANFELTFLAAAGKTYTIKSITRLKQGLEVEAWIYNVTDNEDAGPHATQKLGTDFFAVP